jgi:hypothetical protein
MTDQRLPKGWTVWSDQATKIVLAFRPDVFDTSSFPAPCLPTLYVTKGQRSRRPGRDDPDPQDPWYVTLFLEPEIEGPTREYDSRTAATDGATDLARQFVEGEIDYRSLYQVPRPEYLDELDKLTGHGVE